MDLSTTYLGFELKNPIVVGACPLGTNIDTIRHLEEAGASAIVLPSLFEEEIQAAVQTHLEMESMGGFSEASSFVGAFKRWPGQSPTAYRDGAG